MYVVVLVLICLIPLSHTFDTSTRSLQLEEALTNLIELEMIWSPGSYNRPEGDLVTRFNDVIRQRKAERLAREKEREERRIKENEEWRIRRYAQMREDCDDPQAKWLSELGRKSCCLTLSPHSPFNVSCDLETGTPGNYYYRRLFVEGRSISNVVLPRPI